MRQTGVCVGLWTNRIGTRTLAEPNNSTVRIPAVRIASM